MTGEAFRWWMVIEVAGLIALPITLLIFRNLPGRGYAFAKPVGLLLGGYLFWLALSMHVLPNRPGSVVWVFLVLGVVAFLIWRRYWPELRGELQERQGLIVATEVVFTLAFAVAVYLKSFVPEIAQTEKPMDFMMLNAADRSRYYPPADPWMSGLGVSYYYFGYVIQAMLSKIAAVETAVAFNLALVSTAALTVTAAFGLGYELAAIGRRVALKVGLAVGVLAIVLVAVIGNLENLIEFSRANGDVLPLSAVEWIDIGSVDAAQESNACLVPLPGGCINYPTDQSSFWWWWRSTRISPEGSTITEFPFFSFLLGDLHPHVMALPFVLTALGLGLALWRSTEALSVETWKRKPSLLLACGVLLGGLGFLNTWDLPTFGFVLAVLVAARCWVDRREPKEAAKAAAGFLLPLLAVAALLYVPFYWSFSSQASGLGAVQDGATRPIQSILFWAPLVAATLPLPILLLLRGGLPRTDMRRRLGKIAMLPVALVIAWAVLIIGSEGVGGLTSAVGDRGWNWLTAGFFATALSACLLAMWQAVESRDENDDQALVPVLALMSTGMLLILGAELFYIQDVFSSRLNTVFKLSYQAWLLLAVSSAYGLYYVAREIVVAEGGEATARRLLSVRGLWLAPAALLLACALLYPLGATLSRTDGLSGGNRTLDGLAYARAGIVDDYVVADWLRQRAGPDEVVAQAIGGQYSSASLMSAWTGVPTVLGWPGHEVQWGRSGDEIAERQRDIDAAYSTESLADALTILRKYDVTYVYVGNVELSTYPPAGLQKFVSGLPIASRSNNAVLYRVPPEAPPAVAERAP